MQLYLGDCLEVMAGMEPNSVDSIITDPPYGLEFMGKDWDHGIPGIPFWQEAIRVAKPGAILMAFGGTRTFHRLACAIEDAGWEIRDTMMWVYGSGFPKSHDISKAIDKAAGAEREVVGPYQYDNRRAEGSGPDNGDACFGQYGRAPAGVTAPATPLAQLWEGWGTALKPAWEPIIIAMKPCDGTFAQNAERWGVAGLWIDGGRIPLNGDRPRMGNTELSDSVGYGVTSWQKSGTMPATGRWPANLVHDGSDEVTGLFPMTNGGALRIATRQRNKGWCNSSPGGGVEAIDNFGDSGSAARFFYAAKASRAEREAGCEGMEAKQYSHDGREKPIENAYQRNESVSRNHHPTVKPLALMRYLCRLTKTPTGGIVLDPFMGSGTTGIAALMEGRDFIGIEKEPEYMAIAERRIENARLPLLEV